MNTTVTYIRLRHSIPTLDDGFSCISYILCAFVYASNGDLSPPFSIDTKNSDVPKKSRSYVSHYY